MTDELLEHFLIEGRELTAQAGEDLNVLMRTPDDRARLDSCFRAIHTLKGSVGLFDLPAMARLLHAAEDQLAALRQGASIATDTLVTLVEVVDQVDRWLNDLERAGGLPEDAATVSEKLTARLVGKTGGDVVVEPGVAIRYVPRADAYFAGDDPVAIMAAVPGLRTLDVSLRDAPGPLADYDPFQCNLVFQASSSAPLHEIEAALRWVKDQIELSPLAEVEQRAEEGGANAGMSTRTIRVETARIDRLADITNDLLIAKNGMSSLLSQVDALQGGRTVSQALRAQQARIDRLVTDLHGAVARARLTPLTPLFGRFPRLVRETARALGKAVDFTCIGGEVEIDKDIVDGLFEPLLHVLRNALDHGIEAPHVRRDAGKAETGVLSLVARPEGDRVVLEVRDDGAGVDPVRIRDLAKARGLIDETTAEMIDDRQALDLIFLPGFSTARTVSEISGRGVGMDAVRAAITAAGGRVEFESVAGKGSVVRLTLPISMVVTGLLIVACGGERYGLRLNDVRETVRLDADRIVPVRDREAFQLRDQVTPLIALNDLVGLPKSSVDQAIRRVVVAQVAGELIGFSVDTIIGRMEVAVRPMSGLLANLPGVAGSALLEDGEVLMVLDLAELVS